MLVVGTLAPDFTVKTHKGDTVSLKDFKGKKVILWFYPKADTPGCTAEGCGFRDRISQFKEKNTEVLGVSFDSVDENKAFATKFAFPFSLLCDTDKKIGLAYGACKNQDDKYPARIGYVIGGDGKILIAEPSVDAKTFPETVLKEI